MAEPVRAGTDVMAGTYSCTCCGYPLAVGRKLPLPVCPSCHNEFWTHHHADDRDANLEQIPQD